MLLLMIAVVFVGQAPGKSVLHPRPPVCASGKDQVACGRALLREGEFTDRLLVLRSLKKMSTKEVSPFLAELELLTGHWYPGFRSPALHLLRLTGRTDLGPEAACPRLRDLSGWTQIPSLSRPKSAAACSLDPSPEHQIVFSLDTRTCIVSDNRGEWGSVLSVLSDGKKIWTLQDSLFSPAELVPGKGGYWIIESLNHMGGSGALSILERNNGQWGLRRLAEFPSTVAAWRLIEDRLVLAVRSDHPLPEDPCQAVSGAVLVLSFGEDGSIRSE